MIKEKIRDLIQKNLVMENEGAELKHSDNIFEMGYVNSLFAMKLVTFVEDEFEVFIENDELNIENFSTVDKIVSFIEGKL